MSSDSRLWVGLAVYTLTAVGTVAMLATAIVRHRDAPPGPVHLAAPVVAEPEVPPASPFVLRVCADPHDLPYSNERGEGFENALAELVARDLGREVRYVWQPQRRGFIRTTLRNGSCDVVMSVPAGLEQLRTTRPYYRSTYVFLARRGRARIRSLDDPVLRHLRIGVQVIGEDYENPPPVQALANRHLAANVRGYTVYGNYGATAPQRGLIDAVASGEVDVGIAWGPLAGYFAGQSTTPLAVVAIPPVAAQERLPFTFEMAMGVRRDDVALARALDEVIERREADIRRILQRFGVPLV